NPRRECRFRSTDCPPGAYFRNLGRHTLCIQPECEAGSLLKVTSRSRAAMIQDDHDRGLAHDLVTLAAFAAGRRALLKWGLGLGALPLLACGSHLDPFAAPNGQ